MDLRTVSTAAQKHVAALTRDDASSPRLPLGIDIQVVDVEDLQSIIETMGKSNENDADAQIHSKVLVLEAYFRDENLGPHILQEDGWSRLRDSLLRLLIPSKIFADQSPFFEIDVQSSNSERRRLRALYEACLVLLSHLQKLAPMALEDSPVENTLALASFTNPSDPWTTKSSYEHANNLLQACLKPLRDDKKELQPLLTCILRGKVKPLFAKSKNPAITAAGRKAISPLPAPIDHSIDEADLKPWRYRDVYIVTVFEWVLSYLDTPAIESSWPLLIPPLLALLDDNSTTWKVRGCSTLSAFLRILHSARSNLLERTGLGEVFQSSLMPCLLHLPSLTPEEESLKLLDAVYPALLALVRARFDGIKHADGKQKALDGIFRYGILKGYVHVGEHVRIAELLVRKTGELVQAMGIDSCKHLKDILPMLSGILSAPFATVYPPLLLAAVEAIEIIIVVHWSRIAYHRGETLKGLVVCWCRVEEEDEPSEGLDDLRAKIKECVKLLTGVLEGEVDVGFEYRLLTESDGRLEELLVIQ